MKFSFRIKLFVTMIVFAIIISFAVTIVDYYRLKENAIQNNEYQVKQTEEMVQNSLETIDKAYYFFDQETAIEMKTNTDFLLDLYEENPTIDTWDFQELKHSLGMDIYIINDQNVVINSNVEADVGLDFLDCCKTLARKLDERRESRQFFHDGMDIEQSTGDIKKYSYMATQDKKYMIQLGHDLEKDPIFTEFSFLNVIKNIVEKYDSINDINVLNIGGLPLGEPAEKLSYERRKAFEITRDTKQTTEFTGSWYHNPATYRYVYFTSDYDIGMTKNKVLEIIYNHNALQSVLSKNKNVFILQLIIVLLTTTLISLIISKWVARPMYLAFHDSLTGLKNRAAFNDFMAKHLQENKGKIALIMLDLDNFKLVNDYFGHHKGDYLLQLVASTMNRVVSEENETFRLGGDEFAIIMPRTSKESAEETADAVLRALEESVKQSIELRKINITSSMGIALAPDHGKDLETLYQKADIALYQAKEKGKNQFQVFKSS